MDHLEYVYTVGMTDDEIRERLRSAAAGVLSLAREGIAYAVPISHCYDGESLYLRLADDGRGRKFEFVETTDEACFLLYDATTEDSWSVLARGRLRRLAGDERAAFDEAAVNAAFTPLRVFDEAIEDIEIRVYELELAELTGRRTAEHQ